MKYRNPQIPEGINTSSEHPLKEFLVLATGAVVILVLLAWVLGQAGGALARWVPFSYEQSLVPNDVLQTDAPAGLDGYLDGLSDRVAEAMALPEDMAVQVHFSGDETVNAFATLGGNVMLFRGLVEQLPHENALAMLLAHEMAHVQHRDPIAAIGQGAAIQLAAALVSGSGDLAMLSQAGLYTQLHFSRDMERDADRAALAALQRLYGHVGGADDLFQTIQGAREAADAAELPAIFSSHPLDEDRLAAIRTIASENGWGTDGPTTPLPAEFGDWMAATSEQPVNR